MLGVADDLEHESDKCVGLHLIKRLFKKSNNCTTYQIKHLTVRLA